MGPTEPGSPPPEPTTRPHWNDVLRALREARGVTLDGWGARLGVSRKTVQRWERGERAPDPGAEASILAYGREAALFRPYNRGPLAGLTLTAELVQDLLAEARWRVSGRQPKDGAAGDPAHDGEMTAVPHSVLDPPRSNLPASLTSFVGRERELGEVRRLQAGTRLLTLTGAGGCGKSRVSLQLANELLWAYPNGVWLVDLAPLADPTLVPQTVATALAVRHAGSESSTGALLAALMDRRLLVILDNCEHLLSGCAPLVESLLRACPGLAVLTTSRAPLGIVGETLYHVAPMAVPGSARTSNADGDGKREIHPDGTDAVRLFVERARLYQPAFELTGATRPYVAELCRRLDGIPLALELAAARVTVLSVEQIVARLDDRFQLLTGGGRTALPRQQTLRAALDWSHELLSEQERALLRRLSVFAGGFTLVAVEAVCADGDVAGPPTVLGATDVLDALAHLVDQSLVIAEEQNGGVRYRMLETVREYAAEQLTVAGETRAVRQHHAAWCLALGEAGELHQKDAEQREWLARLAVEHDNLRATLGWCLTDEHGASLGLRLGGALGWFWQMRGHHSEGRRWLMALIEWGGQTASSARMIALRAAAWLAHEQGDVDEAVRLNEQSLAVARELNDEQGIAGALNNLGVGAGSRGDFDRAWALLEESLALWRTVGNRERVAAGLSNLGITARRRGEPERAVTLYEEGLTLMQEMGNTHGVATVLQNLGNLYLEQKAPHQAAARYREALSQFLHLQDRLGAARCLEGLAQIAGARGDQGRAARLCGAAAALRTAIGTPLPPGGRGAVDRTTTAARAALGEDQFTAAWEKGQALTLKEAVVEALSDAPPA